MCRKAKCSVNKLEGSLAAYSFLSGLIHVLLNKGYNNTTPICLHQLPCSDLLYNSLNHIFNHMDVKDT